jgi:pimeloyl-ACP methyl ester carboxylesterase
MPEIRNDRVKIVYDVAGQGRPLVLLHGWSADRSWWTEPGYVDELRNDQTPGRPPIMEATLGQNRRRCP